MDEVKLELARQEAAARGLVNVEFRAANVNDWHEPDGYDLVYRRFLLRLRFLRSDVRARAQAERRRPGSGPEALRVLPRCGHPGPDLHVVQGVAATGEGKTLALSNLQAAADAIVAAGLATEPEVASAISDLAAFIETDSTVIGDPRVFQLWARRGGTGDHVA